MSGVPRLPLLAPWYRLSGDGDRLLLEHGQTVVALEGGAVRTLLPVLLPLLDGTRTRDDLVDRLGVAVRPALDNALELLAAHDLLVEGPDAPVEERPASYALAAAYGLTPAVAADRMRTALAEVVGTSVAAVEVSRLLRLSGIGSVRRRGWRPHARCGLVVVAPAADELDRLDEWNDDALEHGAPWLPVLPYDGRVSFVGPLVVPGESCCYACVLQRRAANLEYGEHLRELDCVPPTAEAGAAFAAFVNAFVAHVAVRWLAGHDTSLPGVLYAVEARPAPTVGEHPVLRVPRCPACSPSVRTAPPLPWHEAVAA